MRDEDRLLALLDEENKALRRLDFPTAVSLLPAKTSASNNLIHRASAGSMSKTEVDLWRRLAALAAENQILLKRAIEVQTRVLVIIARACGTKRDPIQYGTRGQRVPSARTGALTFCRRV